MQPAATPEFVNTLGQIMASAARLTPEKLEEIKNLIKNYPQDQLNYASVGPCHKDNMLNDQFPYERYDELIAILKSKGAIRSNDYQVFQDGVPLPNSGQSKLTPDTKI